MRNPVTYGWQWVREQVSFEWDVSRSAWWSQGLGALRTFFTGGFFRAQPVMHGTVVNYDLARSLYRNDNQTYLYGAGFVRSIIDTTVDYMGMPVVSTGDNATDKFLNECLHDHWAEKLQEVFRDATRDSKVVVRYYQPRTDNPLWTQTDRDHGMLEVLPPESVEVIYDPVNADMVQRAVIEHRLQIDDRTPEEFANGNPPRLSTHDVVEEITASAYTFFDRTAGAPLASWTTPNRYGFVPVWEFWNEYAADLAGGQSDLEPVIPFIQAFNDVMKQALDAHRYHSVPKVQFHVKSVEQFIRNQPEWRNVLDESGRVNPGAKINWQGKEILFFNVDEKGEFLEARSVLGDSKTLLGFLLDCIAISSETPKWALLEDDAAQHTGATTERHKKKVERKRRNFEPALKMILKMALAATGRVPNMPTLHWPHVSVDDFVTRGQGTQQIVMALDVAASHQWISDETAMRVLLPIFPEMNDVDTERALAADNVVAVAPPSPASPTQAIPPAQSTNGHGSAAAAKAALATTKPSQS